MFGCLGTETFTQKKGPAQAEQSAQWRAEFQIAASKGGITMTITEYIVATILVALISCAVLGLLMQES